MREDILTKNGSDGGLTGLNPYNLYKNNVKKEFEGRRKLYGMKEPQVLKREKGLKDTVGVYQHVQIS